jgi:TonB family protein
VRAGRYVFILRRDMKNLFFKMESEGIDSMRGSYFVSNVSLDVPDELFEIPRDYKKVDFGSFMSTLKEKVDPSSTVGKGTLPAGPRSAPPRLAEQPLRIPELQAAASEVDTEPVFKSGSPPAYTEEARKNNIEGVVSTRPLIGSDGRVKSVKITSGLPDGLNEEAIRAVYARVYEPATKNGRPVARWIDVTIEFRLNVK